MVYTTLIPTKTTAPSAAPSRVTLESRLKAALEHARRLTAMNGTQSINVAIAWETVEELQTAKARQKASSQSAFARYCAAHPDAPECRIYEC
ncbi:MAG: Calvin cycle protein CP12 [Cyanobacteria bacterium J06639_14]